MGPVVLGYQQVRLGTSEQDAAARRQLLADFAQRQGFTLGQIFVDDHAGRPCAALVAMIAAARSQQVSAVLVASPQDLGSVPETQRQLRVCVEREAAGRVLIISSVPRGPRTGPGA